MKFDFGIENGQVYINGQFYPLNVYIKDEKISAVTKEKLEALNVSDVKGKYVLPGFIDPHVHFALGVGENVSEDDFKEGSLKAVLGGVTTYIDFLDPVKSAEDIKKEFEKRNKMAKESIIDYAFHTTIANPVSSPEDIIKTGFDYGINSVKLFTTYSETDRRTYDKYIYELLKQSGRLGAKVVVHSENDDLIDKSKCIAVKDHEKSRPAITENIEVLKLAQMVRKTEGNLYIVHVSAGSSAELLKSQYKKEILKGKITLESCPHYFLLNTDCLKKEDGYKYTMTPPIRDEEERIILNECIDVIKTIGTDHCPYPREKKNHKFTSEIPMGIGGIQYSFLNMFSLFGEKIIDKFTKGPAEAYGLKTKGCLLPGFDADITVFNPQGKTEVKDDMSVYYKKIFNGSIDEVYSRGKAVLKEGKIYKACGKYIKRNPL